MFGKSVLLIATVTASSCAQPSDVTTVTNRSDSALQVIYVSKGERLAQTAIIAPGKKEILAGRLSDYSSVEFRYANNGVIFRDSDAALRDAACSRDCGFVWYGAGRVAITA
ncbi:hypothetical protein [Sphingopyxis sp. KK2]|uniref:hypothetical protein n=1 Tax=Sphingopyxis sp. KK2 TaxID=1855727 RepID=UPI00097E671B|nr:hypothetical protein [Sphingopyxis sp. KK2]